MRMNLGGDVATYLDWNEKDADILGDWATPVADGPEPAAAKRQRGRALAKSTRQKFYRANAPQDEHRSRCALAFTWRWPQPFRPSTSPT
jgi:hypothetical protein